MEVLEYLFWYSFVIAIGAFGSIFSDKEYYRTLTLPSLAPRPFVYGIVWTILYGLDATAAALHQRSNDGNWDIALTLYVIFAIVSGCYTMAFFYCRWMWLSTLIMIASSGLSIATVIYYFDFTNDLAGWLFLPTVVWVLFATYIMINVLINNGAGKLNLKKTDTYPSEYVNPSISNNYDKGFDV